MCGCMRRDALVLAQEAGELASYEQVPEGERKMAQQIYEVGLGCGTQGMGASGVMATAGQKWQGWVQWKV